MYFSSIILDYNSFPKETNPNLPLPWHDCKEILCPPCLIVTFTPPVPFPYSYTGGENATESPRLF